jgi:hypothetical protein
LSGDQRAFDHGFAGAWADVGDLEFVGVHRDSLKVENSAFSQNRAGLASLETTVRRPPPTRDGDLPLPQITRC